MSPAKITNKQYRTYNLVYSPINVNVIGFIGLGDQDEHIFTNEIGHALGLRHTDWFSRQSCVQNVEAQEPSGGVQIPGTPTGYDSNSLILAWFSANENGNFGHYDEMALEYLY